MPTTIPPRTVSQLARFRCVVQVHGCSILRDNWDETNHKCVEEIWQRRYGINCVHGLCCALLGEMESHGIPTSVTDSAPRRIVVCMQGDTINTFIYEEWLVL